MNHHEQQVSIFLKEIHLPSLIKFKSVNFLLGICWVILILCGTLIIGACASNYQATFKFCSDSQKICTQYFTLTGPHKLFFYITIYPYYQNNRLYLGSFSNEQIHGQIYNTDKCGLWYTYQSVGVNQTVGGYRMPETAQLHPCGQPIQYVINDDIILIDSSGSTPNFNSGNLVSDFYKNNHFIRLPNYQLSQWVDVLSTNFVNWFIIPFTNTKYVLLGSATLVAGTYQLVLRNNYKTNNQFTKTVVATEIGSLGDFNIVLGFSIFVSGIVILFFHMIICCFQRKKTK